MKRKASRLKRRFDYKILITLSLFIIIITAIFLANYFINYTKNKYTTVTSEASISDTNIIDETYFELPIPLEKYKTPIDKNKISSKPLTSTVSFPVVFAVEYKTANKYPDIRNQLTRAIENINTRMVNAGIVRRWSIAGFRPNYDKTIPTSCLTNHAGYLPPEACDGQRTTYVFVTVDDSASSAAIGNSANWGGFGGLLFSTPGVTVLGHELGHCLGLPDLYHIKIRDLNNYVNSQTYMPFSGDIMNNYTPGAFSAYEKDLISRINPTIPAIWGGWKLFQPLNNKIQLLDKNSNPIPNIPIKIYTSRFTLEVETGLIDTIPEYSGQTDTSGYFQLGSNILTANGEISGIIAFLIQSKIAGKNYYNWLNFTDVNYAYWNGQIDSAVYKIYPFPVNPTAQFTANPTSVCLEHATIPTVTFNFKAFDINGNLDYVKILYSRVNDGSGNWTQIGRNINCSGSSTCLLSKISWHPTSVAMGDYYVVINAYDDQGLWCSGNATGTSLKNLWGKQLSVSNLSDCASGSFGPDVRIVNLRNCTPASGDTRPPIP